ncbi:hypothetical protein QC763_0095880 [Podospora pseudopauciseta]|uniref:Uncharacterized protein n=1 Tax=Podospora pseudopauciseta TaxID=2093780 RepID=A0ABR0H5J2_9PEZI|nr:hypothetical protein QC763_0095880 [Podospora pseudopauciseta]
MIGSGAWGPRQGVGARNHLAADWRGLDLSLALSLSLLPDLVILLLVYPPLLSSTFSFVSRPHLLLVSSCLVTLAFLLERYIPVGTGVRRCRPTALFQTTPHRLVSQLTTPSTVVWSRSLFSHVVPPGNHDSFTELTSSFTFA